MMKKSRQQNINLLRHWEEERRSNRSAKLKLGKANLSQVNVKKLLLRKLADSNGVPIVLAPSSSATHSLTKLT